ncbi:hypothetical protein [Streptomyces sp. NPDC006193]|uniref:hypothetical protein n=1 Tax=Streptomyces sp. NPDC006193 TaxID=3155717 RepID=UPI0033BDBAF8
MPAHATSAIAATVATGIVLAARWRSAGRGARTRFRAGPARPPWRRTAGTPAPGDVPPPVRQAEEHVYRCWRHLRTQYGYGD